MISAEILDLLSLSAERLPAAAPLTSTNTFAQRSPGERFNAMVEASLDANLFKVRVDGQAFAMRLPPQASAANHLELVLLANGPRPVFALQESQAQEPVLSPTARMVDELVQQSASQPVLKAAAGPALVTTPADLNALTVALENAIGTSGMFYESHQAQWVRGKRGLDALRAEPQAQFPPQRAAEMKSAGAASGAVREEFKSPLPVNGSPDNIPSPSATENSRAHDLGETASHVLSSAAKSTSTDPQILNIVRQQIETLESRQIVWQGEIWPQQTVQWKIHEDPPDGREPDTPPEWRSGLQLDLPRLGGVHANLDLRSAGLAVRISANSESAAKLRAHLPQLAQSLAARGISVLGLEVTDASAS